VTWFILLKKLYSFKNEARSKAEEERPTHAASSQDGAMSLLSARWMWGLEEVRITEISLHNSRTELLLTRN
jgi:hypothetical protein